MRHLTHVFALALLLGQAAFATTLTRLDLDDLTAQSSAIVHGRIVASRTEWNAGGTAIFTVYTVSVNSYLKGQLGETFEIAEPGGSRDGITMTVASVPVFQPSQEVVLFIWTDPRGVHQVIGFEQGALQVVTDPVTGAKSVDREIRLGSASSVFAQNAPIRTTSKSLPQLFNQIRTSAAAVAKSGASAK